MPAQYLPIVAAVASECGEAARTFAALLDLWMPGKPFFKRHALIAEHAGLSVHTVGTHLKTLVEKGWLVDHGRIGKRSNTYSLRTSKEEILKTGFVRFPLSARHIRGWSQVVVLSIIVHRCDCWRTGRLSDASHGKGRIWLASVAREYGLSFDQVDHAFASLRGRSRTQTHASPDELFIKYDPKTCTVEILVKFVTGKEGSGYAGSQGAGIEEQGSGYASRQGAGNQSEGAGIADVGSGYPSCIEKKHLDSKHGEKKQTREKTFQSKQAGLDFPPDVRWSDQEKAFAKKFARFVQCFRNIDCIDQEVAEIIVAVVYGAWNGDPELFNLCPASRTHQDKTDTAQFLDFNSRFVQPALMKGQNPGGLLVSMIRTNDVRIGIEASKSLRSGSELRKTAKRLLPLVRELVRKYTSAPSAPSAPENQVSSNPSSTDNSDVDFLSDAEAAWEHRQKLNRLRTSASTTSS